MDIPDSEKSPPNRQRGPPLQHGRQDESDEYSSDDELDDHDLNLLNTDYASQRDLSFYPVPRQPNSNFNSSHNPSIPPSLRQPTTPTAQSYASSNNYPQDANDREEESPVLPRRSSLGKTMLDSEQRHRLPTHSARAYQDRQPRRPLVDYIRNEWRNAPLSSSSKRRSSYGSSTPYWIQVLSAPRFRRYVLMLFVVTGLIWGNWHYWAGDQWKEHQLLGESLKERIKTGGGWFGENMRPEFLDMVHVTSLDQGLVPQKGDGKRLIVIGDVHGCHDELVNLLAEVQYEARTDHLIFAGDFISKGPSSPAVVDLAMSAHASCVRGNHEDRVLLAYRDMYSHRMTHEQKSQKSRKSSKVPPPPMPGMPEDMKQNDPLEDEVEEVSFEHGDAVDRRLAKSFTKRQIEYMSACPVILDVGEVKGMGDVQVVHAGLVPGVKLDKQDPVGAMHMRTIDLDTFVPSTSATGTAWYKLWNRYQSFIPSSQRSTVIYGHDSRRGLQIHDYSKGLDTGCVKGGKLTSLVVESGGKTKTISVPCKDHREPAKEGVDSKKEVE
ncbi:hypothetical protein ACLMJK_003083 [Lecanora helva]